MFYSLYCENKSWVLIIDSKWNIHPLGFHPLGSMCVKNVDDTHPSKALPTWYLLVLALIQLSMDIDGRVTAGGWKVANCTVP